MANLPPSFSIAPSSAAPGAPIAAPAVTKDQDMATAEQLVLDLCNPELREKALHDLSKKQEIFQDLAPLLWHSFGTIAALLQEIMSIYSSLSPPTLSPDQSNRVCNVLALLQCVATNDDTRPLFLAAQIPLYLYPFLNTQNKARQYEYLRTSSLVVIGALVKVDDPEVIAFLLGSEIIPLCLRTMEMGSEVSKTVATFIVQKIMLDNSGLHYVCASSERYFAVVSVLALMVESVEHPSPRLLKHIILCYLRLTYNARACSLLHKHLPISFTNGTLNKYLQGNNNLSFSNKQWMGTTLAWESKAMQPRHANKVLCMSVEQASKSKIAVTPPHMENAKEPPLNTYKPKEPYTATIVSVERLVGPKAPGETCHVVIDHGGNVPYWEGQSYGVIPPGENPKKPGAPHNVRLYSIASTRYGDNFDGKTASLCVRRAVYYDPETGKEDPSKNGICSNFLCNSKPGDKIRLTGPSGKIMLLPEDDPNATHIMIATGTGVAPFRGYLRRMFMEDVLNYRFGGLAWLFLGVANSDSLLYDEEFANYLKQYPDNFRYDKALSREQKNMNGGKMYVQDKIEEYSDEIFKLLDGGAHIYFCGLKGMMPGIQGTLKKVAEQRGESWDQKLSMLKKNKQWHVEVY